MKLAATPSGYGMQVRLCGCAGLTKARRTVHKTRVSRYVSAKQSRVSAKILAVFSAAKARGMEAAKHNLKKAVSVADQAYIDDIINEIDPEGMAGVLVEEISQDMVDAYKIAGIQGVIDVITADPSIDITSHIDQAALDYVSEHGAELVTQISDTTLSDLRDFLGEAVADGMSVDEVSVAIDDWGGFGEARSDMIARTELAFAHVQGNVEGWRQTDQVDRKRWILGDNHAVPDECDDAVEAGTVGIDDVFGDTDIDFPPAHPNCVCDVIPVLKDEE